MSREENRQSKVGEMRISVSAENVHSYLAVSGKDDQKMKCDGSEGGKDTYESNARVEVEPQESKPH